MPGDRFTLAVRVGREIDLVGLLGLLADLFQHLAATAQRNVLRFKIVLDIHAHLALRQIAHMAVGRDDLIMASEKLSDRFGLGRRLYDD